MIQLDVICCAAAIINCFRWLFRSQSITSKVKRVESSCENVHNRWMNSPCFLWRRLVSDPLSRTTFDCRRITLLGWQHRSPSRSHSRHCCGTHWRTCQNNRHLQHQTMTSNWRTCSIRMVLESRRTIRINLRHNSCNQKSFVSIWLELCKTFFANDFYLNIFFFKPPINCFIGHYVQNY